MKYIIILLLLVPFTSRSQDNNIITNLQLKGGTIKLIVAVLEDNGMHNDTSLLNLYHKWYVDYTDGTVPTDNANVTISTTKTVNIISIYRLLLRLPAGYVNGTNFLTDFTTSLQSKRNTNSILDTGMTSLESTMSTEYTGLLSKGGGSLQSK